MERGASCVVAGHLRKLDFEGPSEADLSFTRDYSLFFVSSSPEGSCTLDVYSLFTHAVRVR